MTVHRTTIRVIYGDTDKMGYAYYANYLRWFESARNEMFREWGLPYTLLEEKGYFLPVSESFCKYISPARYDDLIVIDTTLDPKVKAGMKFDYTVLSEDEQTVHATGYTLHAYLNSEGKVVRPPKFLKEILAAHDPSNGS